MDVDPLADTVPPRHALESDEEDEYNPLTSTADGDHPPALDVKIIGNLKKSAGLIVASGDFGKYWARGADLGEQTAGVYANKTQIGLVFNPEWTETSVIVSEVTSRLPLWAMSKYAETVLDEFQPSSIALLDVYPVPSYISAEALPFHNSPIRFLTTEDPSTDLTSKAEPFSPPNLLQGTSAAFMSLAGARQLKATAILLPYPTIPPPAPRTIAPSDFSHISDDPVKWSSATVNIAQELAFNSLQGGESSPPAWKAPTEEDRPVASNKRNDSGDDSMYI